MFVESILRRNLSCPTKSRLSEIVIGRNIYNLVFAVIYNLKKSSAMADEWLDDGETLPSGKSWEDLYDHVLSNSREISNDK